MKPHVFTTAISAETASETITKPASLKFATMRSESAVFLEQPKLRQKIRFFAGRPMN
jgi:hypothetical protein